MIEAFAVMIRKIVFDDVNRIHCGIHKGLPDWCWELHYPNSIKKP